MVQLLLRSLAHAGGRTSIVLGGWPQNTQRQSLVPYAREAVEKVGIKELLDDELFATACARASS